MDISARDRMIEKWFNEYFVNESIRKEKIEGIMSSTNYVDWLKKFTQDKVGFTDCDYSAFDERIDYSDKYNIDMLDMFYDGIDKYANENYIYPTPADGGYFYRVKLDDFGFEIGFGVRMQEAIYYVNRLALGKHNTFIDFNDIIAGKKQDNVDRINAKLNVLSSIVVKTYESGVPIEALVDTLDDTIDNIASKNNAKTRVLLRRDR